LFGTALLHSANRFVRQQQRRESMRRFAYFVNFFFSSVSCATVAGLTNQPIDSLGIQQPGEEEAQYSNAFPVIQALSKKTHMVTAAH
jgi:hypothetical protein